MFYWVQVWRLARPLQDLEMLLTEPLLSCPCCVFGVIVMLEDPATTHLQFSYWGKEVVGQNLAIHCPSIRCSRPVPFAEKHPQSMMFPPPCIMFGMVFLGFYSSFFFLQTRRVEFIFWSHLTTWPSPMPPLDHPDGIWQTSDGPGHVLSWAGRPCAHCRMLIHDGVVY